MEKGKAQHRKGASGPGAKSPPCNAGDLGSTPGQETETPHAKGQLSPQCNWRVQPLEQGQREIPRAATESQGSQTNK